MKNAGQHLDTIALQELVFGDESTDSWQQAATHAESCPQCLDRLKELSGEHTIAEEAATLLSTDRPGATWQPDATAENHDVVDDALYLESPSHPEMLGRIGRYEVERRVGVGGMGVVFKGFDSELNRPVAVKVLARHLSHSGAARQRFAREARSAAAVVHEHVVSIHNVETEGRLPFLVMQYVPGESLQARVQRMGPLQNREILRIGIQAAAGLAAAHEQGVIHRDVKPANILLEQSVERILLTDFGLARTVDDASMTNTGLIAGTPHYMSPEQASGESTDYRTDLFSLGSVLYFMATGHPPFRADRAMGVLHRICTDRHRPVSEVNPEISDDLSDIVDQLLQKKPTRRISSAVALREILTELLERLQQPRPWWDHKARRFVRGLRKHRVLAGTVAVVGMAAASLPFLMHEPQPESVEPADSGLIDGAEQTQPSAGESASEVAESSSIPSDEKTDSSTAGVFDFTSSDSPFDEAGLRSSAAALDRDLMEFEQQANHRFLTPHNDQWRHEIELLNEQLDQLERRIP